MNTRIEHPQQKHKSSERLLQGLGHLVQWHNHKSSEARAPKNHIENQHKS